MLAVVVVASNGPRTHSIPTVLSEFEYVSLWQSQGDPETTALTFTRDYLGFTEIDRVTDVDEQDAEAWIGVGFLLPNDREATAAKIHLVRSGTDSNAAWDVVGTQDTTLTVTSPAYGSSAGRVLDAAGEITGVDESVHVVVRQRAQPAVVGEFCCVQTGGDPGSWSARIPVKGAVSGPLTMVVSTGGHVARVEKFAITGLRAQ